MELNAYKMELLREIVNEFNSETSLKKLAAACRLIRNEEESNSLPTMPAHLLQELMDNAAREEAEGKYITDKELKKEMLLW